MKINVNRALFWLVLIDILFFPYFNVVVIPYSYFVILGWVVKNRRYISRTKELKPFLVCMALMLVSTLIGIVVNAQYGVLADNLKRLIQYYFVFGYYFFFKYYFEKYEFDLKRTLFCFVCFVAAFAVLFNANTVLFGEITTFWNPGNAYNLQMIEDSTFIGVFRYNFIWTDPNNIAYAITGIVIFIFMFTETGLAEKVLLIFINIFVLISCMSSGGWINFALTYLAYFIYVIMKSEKLFSEIVKVNLRAMFFFIAVCVLVICFRNYIMEFLQSDVATFSFERFETNEQSRTAIWGKILQGDNIFKYIFLGKGSEIYINGKGVATHSGHLYWVYAYGFVSYFIMMKYFFSIGFKQFYRYIPLVSFFLCFTVNTMVGEQKLFIILILIICYLQKGTIRNGELGKHRCAGV